jgi:hypothetical protein
MCLKESYWYDVRLVFQAYDVVVVKNEQSDVSLVVVVLRFVIP